MLHARIRGSVGALVGISLTLAMALGFLMLVLNRQYVIDQIAYMQYEPSAEIVGIADRTAMNKAGRFMFFASTPTLSDAASFNVDCANTDPEGATLGCYSGNKIYIYNIKDERLDGIKEVTAAHEMLHAVYDRQSAVEKVKINNLLDAAYAKVKTDTLAERMDMYERTQPGTYYNELHSIIGTEYGNLAPELEAHYGEYFEDRSKVVGLYDSYYSQFKELSDRSDQLSAELESLSAVLKSESAAYNQAVATLSSDINAYNSKPNSTSLSQYYQLANERSELMARMSKLEADKMRINEMTAKYNQLVEEYNSVNSETTALYRSIDSSLAPTPSL